MKQIDMSEEQLDALKEIFNIGIGQAAIKLNEIMGHHVHIEIPKINLVDSENLVQNKWVDEDKIYCIRQGFFSDRENMKKKFQGISGVLFPFQSGNRLIELLMSADNEELNFAEYTEYTRDSLLEVGNIIINALIASFSNAFDIELQFSLPVFRLDEAILLFSKQEHIIILVETLFSVASLSFSCHLFISMEIDSMDSITQMLDHLLS